MSERTAERHDTLLTLNEAAKRLGLASHWSLRRWCAAHKFPHVRCGTRAIRVRESDVVAFIRANLVRADPRVALDGLPADALEGVEADDDGDGDANE